MDKTNKKMSKKTKRVCIIFMLFFLYINRSAVYTVSSRTR